MRLTLLQDAAALLYFLKTYNTSLSATEESLRGAVERMRSGEKIEKNKIARDERDVIVGTQHYR